MENDLAEIKERQDLLEAHLNALESRLDGQQGWTDIVTAMLGPAARPNVEPTAPVARAHEFGQSRLQAGVDGLADRLNSIADTLRRIEGRRHDR